MIGQLLINQSIINENQLEEALKIQKKSNKLLGKILEELGYCFNEDIAQTIARNAGLPYMDIDDMNIDIKIVACIPANLAVRNNMVPVRIDGDTVTIACANEPDQRVISNLKRITRKNVDVVIACDRSIKKILLESFSKTKQVKDQLQDSAGAGESVSGILEETILKAIRSRSTDIHFEPERDGFRIRLRIDGMLSGTIKLAKELPYADDIQNQNFVRA